MHECRHIKVIIDLPVSQLTDEEIAKAACKRLGAKMAALIYLDEDGHSYFLSHYADPVGAKFWTACLQAWEKMFTKVRRIRVDEEVR